MTIRIAVDDSKTALKPVTTFLHNEVRTKSGPDPPPESVASIGERVADPNFVCMIDDLAGENVPVGYHTVAGFYVVTEGNPDALVPEAQVPHIIVIWWLPREEWAEDNMPLLIAVFGAACEEVMRRYPGSDRWPIYGDYRGVGETWDERDKSSGEMVTEWVGTPTEPGGFWNSSPTVGIFGYHKINPYNESQHRVVGTVGQAAAFAAWLAAERQA